MVTKRKLKYLHKLAHHTNLENPYSKYVSASIFPQQDSSKLGEVIELKYKNMNDAAEFIATGEEGKYPWYDYGEFDPHIKTGQFTIVRFDLSEPYRFIAISLDGDVIVVSSTYDDKYLEEITEYSIQYEEFNGLNITDKYNLTPEAEINAISVRVDNGEPCYSVLAELLPNNYIRFVIGDEVTSIVNEVYDPTIYDGLDARDYALSYIDLDGTRPDDRGQTVTIDVDGKGPDLLKYLYKYESLSRVETAELRLTLLKERTLYGTS